ncbi:MAG: type 3 dihydrofolate reductase [Proteobacteria bacterium]|nr:MAG: type 3 dihydrofolate reductase [Pseudomonadota bacterium]
MLTLVVAAARNGVIGRDNRLPWRLSADLKYFKAVTMGKPVVMGRKTYESIGRPLPGRRNIVVSRQRDLAIEGCIVVPSLEAAWQAAADAPEIMVIGGEQIFREVLPQAGRIHLTRVHADVEGDTWMPELRPEEWREVHVEHHPADERNEYAFSIVQLERV